MTCEIDTPLTSMISQEPQEKLGLVPVRRAELGDAGDHQFGTG